MHHFHHLHHPPHHLAAVTGAGLPWAMRGGRHNLALGISLRGSRLVVLMPGRLGGNPGRSGEGKRDGGKSDDDHGNSPEERVALLGQLAAAANKYWP
ncbi:MAG: hypothetical protein ACXWUN_10575 [Allosphingosinicella sp.]